MRWIRNLLFLIVFATVSGAAAAQPPAPPVPTPPRPPAVGNRPLPVIRLQAGVSDSAPPRRMRGKVSLAAMPSGTVEPKSIEYEIDGKPIGRSETKPLYTVEFDTTAAADGAHVIKAVGRDESGKENWTASLKVEIMNRSAKQEGAITPSGPDTPPVPSARAARAEGRESARSKRTASAGPPRAGTVSKSGRLTRAAARTLPNGLKLDAVYSNADYGFSINYPGSWTFKDQSATMKRRSESDFLLQFGSYPIEKAPLVVNIRRVKLEEGTDAAKFAKYNTFVKTWRRSTVLGCPAFAATTRVLRPKPGVIHRLIIIKDGCAWMLNCTDYTGKSPEESRALFEAMVESIGPAS